MDDDIKQILNTLVALAVACVGVVATVLAMTFIIKPVLAWFFNLF